MFLEKIGEKQYFGNANTHLNKTYISLGSFLNRLTRYLCDPVLNSICYMRDHYVHVHG